MNRSILYQLLLVLIISSLPCQSLFCQEKLDHEVMLERVKHSSENAYKECIKEYDAYLNQFPDDVSVLVEKCKFIQYAQYDEDEDYNPHQAEFDSCSTALVERFPIHPKVLIFQTTYKWGDELEEVFKNAEKAIKQNPKKWDSSSRALLYKAMADQHYYYTEDYQKAYTYIKKAISYDKDYQYTLEYADILAEVNRKKESLNILRAIPDTTKNAWVLLRKANLLFELEAYPEALNLYKLAEEIDPSYITNSNIASTLEGIGEYEQAREYLVADISKSWSTEQALRALLRHDLRYQDGDKCISSYNQFRDLGYSADPIAFYRLKLFFLHPFQPWKFRDILGLASLLLILAILVIIPYMWILPIYFIGNRWKLTLRNKPYQPQWGLKAFWFVSAGLLITSFLACIAEPETIYYAFGSKSYGFDVAPKDTDAIVIISTIGTALLGFAAMYKVNPKVLLRSSWPIIKSIMLGIGALFIFKIISAIYIKLGSTPSIPIISGSMESVEAIVNAFGPGMSLLVAGLLVPIYEEIIFRGVILDSCQRYLSFNAANIIQSVIFALVHMNLFLLPVYFLFGLSTGYLRKKSGGLLSGIVFHALNNILAILLYLLLISRINL